MNLHKILVMIALALLLAACGSEGGEANNGGELNGTNQDGDADGDGDDQGPTYYGEIEPLMQAHCTSCHVPDSIAPFALQNFEEVKATAVLSLATMEAKTMPPWPPADDCGEFKAHRGMSAEEIALFRAWMEADYPEGTPGETTGDEIQEIELGAPDLSLDIGVDYKPLPAGGDGIDDYRCFVIDPELSQDRFVNLVNTRPGNPAVVHHMIAYMAPPSQFDRLEQLQAEDSAPGYRCFGGPRISNPEMLAGWVPGQTPIPMQEGFGVRLAAGTKLVVQMHYNTLNDPEGRDRTALDLFFVDEQTHPQPKELVILPLAQGNLFVAAGDPDGIAQVSGPSIPLPIMLHGIAPHMHTLGTSIRVDITAGGQDRCLINIPEWDFNWQGFYIYEEPMQLAAPNQAHLTCRYDNSPENQPEGREPRDVYWGDGTYDEMCLVYFIIERPPGF